MSAELPDCYRQFVLEFDRRLEAYVGRAAGVPSELLEAVQYSALAPGKRIRPYLVVRCCELAGGSAEASWPVAAAVECVHAFSLVHDDLPAIDNDDVRRGRPTTHKKFGEAMAILAGDALIVLAFELLARHVSDRALCAEMILELARHTGWAGMIGGQAADILGEAQPPSLPQTQYIHARKTACLFEAACRLGAMAGRGDAPSVKALGRYGQFLGQAFQIADDLLDVTATTDRAGKAVAKDASAGKQTYPRCVGVEQSRIASREAAEQAIAQMEGFGERADDLRQLARYAAERSF